MNTQLLTTHWQTLPEPTIRRLQTEKLRHYLRQVVLPASALYREMFRAAGLKPESIRSLADWENLRFTDKSDLLNSPDHPQRAREYILQPDARQLARRPSTILRAMLHGRENARRHLEAEYRPVFMTSTTGRSADPIPFLFTQHDLDNLSETGRRLFEVCGGNREDRMLNMFPYAPHLAFWQTHYGGTAFGALVVGTGGGKVMGTEGNIRLIRKINPDVLIGMPTFLYHLLVQAVREGVRCEKLRRFVLGGEKAPAGLRRKLTELALQLGAPDPDVVGTYGFTECKMAWAECPAPPGGEPSGYHLYPDFGLVEIINPKTGAVVPDGQPGEIVFTPLDARGSVVLRYRTGDMIEGGLTHEPCPYCGRRGPRLVGNISRVSEIKSMQLDKLKGTLVDFNQLEHVLDDAPNIGAWQLELRKLNDDPLDLDELVLHVQKIDGKNEEQIRADLNERFVAQTEIHPNRISFESAEELRRLQGVGVQLKEQKVIDHRPKNLTDAPVIPAVNCPPAKSTPPKKLEVTA